MKRRAAETQETPQQIISGCVQALSQAAATQMPDLSTVRRHMRRQRQRAGNPHPIPTDLSEMPIPQEYTVTSSNQQFLQADLQDPARLLLFASPEAVQLLQDSNHWFVDGTFKTCPDLFYQVYTIHALKLDRVLPCVYVLLANKSQPTYECLFAEVKRLVDTPPVTLLMDFERAAYNAASLVFPDTVIKGCFFHLCQNVYRQVQSNGLQAVYGANTEIAIQARMIPSLAFVDPGNAEEALDLLSDQLPDELQPIMDYFECIYFGRRTRHGRRSPSFPLAFWSMWDRMQDRLPRTNNSVEGWHCRFQANIGASHPNIWSFLSVLKKEEAVTKPADSPSCCRRSSPTTQKEVQRL